MSQCQYSRVSEQPSWNKLNTTTAHSSKYRAPQCHHYGGHFKDILQQHQTYQALPPPDVPFICFSQYEVPKLQQQGRILLQVKYHISMAAAGGGRNTVQNGSVPYQWHCATMYVAYQGNGLQQRSTMHLYFLVNEELLISAVRPSYLL